MAVVASFGLGCENAQRYFLSPNETQIGMRLMSSATRLPVRHAVHPAFRIYLLPPPGLRKLINRVVQRKPSLVHNDSDASSSHNEALASRPDIKPAQPPAIGTSSMDNWEPEHHHRCTF